MASWCFQIASKPPGLGSCRKAQKDGSPLGERASVQAADGIRTHDLHGGLHVSAADDAVASGAPTRCRLAANRAWSEANQGPGCDRDRQGRSKPRYASVREVIWVVTFAVGALIGLLVGRWWALLAALAVFVFIYTETGVDEVPAWALALMYAGLFAAGVVAGVVGRGALSRAGARSNTPS
jgi:hypothetical protein